MYVVSCFIRPRLTAPGCMAVEIEAHLNTYMFESRLSSKHLFTTFHTLYYAIWNITREWWFKLSRIKIVHISTEMSHMSSAFIICNTLHTIQSQSPHKMPKLRIFKPLSCRYMTAFHLGCTPPYSSKLGHRHVVHVIWSRSLATVHPGNNSLASRLCHFGFFYDVIKWKLLSRYWPFVRGIHRSSVNSPHKSQWRGPLMFSLICAWINGWVNNRETGDLRRHRTHYDVIVMVWYWWIYPSLSWES